MLIRHLFLSLSARIQKEKVPSDEVDISALSQQNVDRFAVLMDLWTSEAEFLEGKLKVEKDSFAQFPCTCSLSIYVLYCVRGDAKNDGSFWIVCISSQFA